MLLSPITKSIARRIDRTSAVLRRQPVPCWRISLATLLLGYCVAAHDAVLVLENIEKGSPVMQCVEWSGFVQSMADAGIERFLVLAREYIQQSKWPFVELAGHLIKANQLERSNVAGTMAFIECRRIP